MCGIIQQRNTRFANNLGVSFHIQRFYSLDVYSPPTWRRSFMLSSVASLHLKYSDYNPPIFVKNFSVKQGRIQEFVKGGGGPSRPLPLALSLSFCPSSPFLPLEVGPLKSARGSGERCKLPQWGPGRCPSRKRIRCTLKLSESHWWQSFWIF